mmetsp:Transcript_778/g.833  ORF Transcript_778/g.833 Transcript_778/m.833 type:complete len:118 (+) Transcript_778:48-401(+)
MQNMLKGMEGNPQMSNMMGQLLPHLPKILSVLSAAPGVAFGCIMTIVFFVLCYGTTTFRETIAPIAGFHILALVIAKRLYRYAGEGYVAARVVQARHESVERLARDIKMMSHEPQLD